MVPKQCETMNGYTVNPRDVYGTLDYNNIAKEFGVQSITPYTLKTLSKFTGEPHLFLRRNLVSFHRNLDLILSDYKARKGFFLVTGRGPSNHMHLGHLIPFIMSKWLQDKFNVNLYIQLSDDEKFLNTTKSIEEIRNYSKNNMADIAALDFDKDKTFIFSDTDYIKNLYPLSLKISKKIDMYKSRKSFGLDSCKNPATNFYPILQMTTPVIENCRSLNVVGLDQDPYYKVQNEIADSLGHKKVATILNKFLPSLSGTSGKMNASTPEGTIYLSDTKDQITKTVKKYLPNKIKCHKNDFRDPFNNMAFLMLYYILEENDNEIKTIQDQYVRNEINDSYINQLFLEKITKFLETHQSNKERMSEFVDSYTNSGNLAMKMRSKIHM